jgi:hypothetical protein
MLMLLLYIIFAPIYLIYNLIQIFKHLQLFLKNYELNLNPPFGGIVADHMNLLLIKDFYFDIKDSIKLLRFSAICTAIHIIVFVIYILS